MSIKSIHDKTTFPDAECEYTLVLIAKGYAQDTYGIAAQDIHGNNPLYIKEIGTDKELSLSLINILNHHKVSYVHFLDVIDDLMNE